MIMFFFILKVMVKYCLRHKVVKIITFLKLAKALLGIVPRAPQVIFNLCKLRKMLSGKASLLNLPAKITLQFPSPPPFPPFMSMLTSESQQTHSLLHIFFAKVRKSLAQ